MATLKTKIQCLTEGMSEEWTEHLQKQALERGTSPYLPWLFGPQTELQVFPVRGPLRLQRTLDVAHLRMPCCDVFVPRGVTLTARFSNLSFCNVFLQGGTLDLEACSAEQLFLTGEGAVRMRACSASELKVHRLDAHLEIERTLLNKMEAKQLTSREGSYFDSCSMRGATFYEWTHWDGGGVFHCDLTCAHFSHCIGSIELEGCMMDRTMLQPFKGPTPRASRRTSGQASPA